MQERRNFLIIGFTGPIGAGCTTAANFFSNPSKLKPAIEGLISKENFLETEKQIYDLYKRMILAYDSERKQKYKEGLEEIIRKREFLKVLKYYYNETPEKFKIKYISFSKALMQELVERILFGDLKKEIKNFPNNQQYLDIVSKIEKLSNQLLTILNLKKKDIKKFWTCIIARRFGKIKENGNHWSKFKEYLDSTYNLVEQIKNEIINQGTNGSSNYISFFQDMGTMIRLKGSVLYHFSEEENLEPPHPIYALSYRINLIIKFFRHYTPQKYNRFVIEAFRNPFEIEFFRQRYYEFYLFSLFAPFNIRQKRHPDIANLEARDKIDQGIDSLTEEEKEALRNKFQKFTDFDHEEILQVLEIAMQNTQRCVELSDININNQTDCKERLYNKLLFYYTLILQPGFVPPSSDETLMNMAYMLSLQSTCISRQVGAIITEENGYIVGAGWNDVSEGQIGCGLRWRKDCEELDNEVLPLHPLSKKEFRKRIINDKSKIEESFCFKDEYSEFKFGKKLKNLQYCRALHAEENAILQTAKIGGMGLKNAATIYTTTFPCELCAKKIYQVGIDRIVYVEPYPKSISEEVFFKDGIKRPIIEQFEGVKPYSYFRLYKPLFNKKDWQEYFKNSDIRKLLLS